MTKLVLAKAAHKRFSYERRTAVGSREAKILFKAYNEEPVFVEDADGHLIREWKREDMSRYTDGDIRQALLRRHAVEEEDLLEYLPPSGIKAAVTWGYLVKDGFWYRPTRKAAAKLGLPRTDPAGRKIRFVDTGLV
jgi:hypothetical protein